MSCHGLSLICFLILCIFYLSMAMAAEISVGGQVTEVLVFEPSSPLRIFEGDLSLVNITYNGTNVGEPVLLRVVLQEDAHLERVRQLSNQTMEFRFENGGWICDDNCSIEVEGRFLGEAELRFRVCSSGKKMCVSEENFITLQEKYHIYVSREPRAVDTVFTVVIVMFGCVVNLGMGCKIDMEIVKATLRRPIAPAVGFVCQFLFMPVLAFGYTKLLQLSTSESVGLFANGCSPGGGASNMWTLLLNGDVSLSITMTVVSTFSSLAMFPLWMFTLGRFIVGSNFRIAFENIVLSLVGIVVPSIIGILIQRYRPKVAKIIEKSLKPLLLVLLIFMFTVGIWINFFMFKLFTWRLILAACFLPWSGFLCGFVVSLITRRKKSHIIAITLETGIQNAGVAIMTLRLSLPQPQNDLSIVGAVCPSIFTAIPLMIFLAVYAIYGRVKKQSNVELKDMNNLNECPGTPASMRSTVFLTEPVNRRKSVPW